MSSYSKELVREIDETVEVTFDLATRSDARRREGSRREAYLKGIREVQTTAGKEAARELAEWIQAEISERERFPTARQVRKQGARICRERGHDVSTGSWLGA